MTHIIDIRGAPDSVIREIAPLGPTKHLLHEATLLRQGDNRFT